MSSPTLASRRSPFPSHSPSRFLAMPTEILLNIISLLVGQTPLGPPAALIPLMLTCRALHGLTTRPELLAQICRFKFDVGAVHRRIITPWNTNLMEHLIHTCRVLRALRRGLPYRDANGNEWPNKNSELDIDQEEIEDWKPPDVLFACLLLMLDNDGKNIAQLEWAGIYEYTHRFIMERLWDGAHVNDGWPLDNLQNSSALWVMWLITDRDTLKNESVTECEIFVDRIFPYVVLPQRYAASEAPPNHFHLPLENPSTAHIPQQVPLSFPIPSHSAASRDYTPKSGPQYYPHYLHREKIATPYFGVTPILSPPPITIAAKLLYVGRRERQGFAPPPHVPLTRASAPPGHMGPTQEDYLTLNAARGAVVPKKCRWDWDKGYCREVGEEEQVEVEDPSDGSSKKHDVFNEDEKRQGGGGDDDRDDEEKRPDLKKAMVDGSRHWDTTFWRMRLCHSVFHAMPRFAPGAVFDPGCMRGIWKGKIYIPSGIQFSHILNVSPGYPGVANDQGRCSEMSLGLVMQPVFLEIQEHHRVCLKASYYRRRDGRRKGKNAAARKGNATVACGTIPVPPPAHRVWNQYSYAIPFLDRLEGVVPEEDDNEQERQGSDEGSTSASTGASASPLTAQGQGAPPSAQTDRMIHDPLGAQNVPTVPHNPNYEPTRPGEPDTLPSNPSNRAVRSANLMPRRELSHVDLGMTNAWFPGSFGDMKWATREGGYVTQPGNERMGLGRRRRDDLLVSLGRAPDGQAQRGCNIREHKDGGMPDNLEKTWIYETYDPDRVGAHELRSDASSSADPAHEQNACTRCAELKAKMEEIKEDEAARRERREAREHRKHMVREARRKERGKLKDDAIRALDAAMRTFGGIRQDAGTAADDVMQDLDTEGGIFGVGSEDVDSQQDSDSDSDSDDQISILGDDYDYYNADEDEDETMDSPSARMREMPDDTPRNYSPSRILRPSATDALTTSDKDRAHACPSATADIIVTGATPASARMWGRKYMVYGRVRPWDGLVGMLRVGENMVSPDYLFMFGYVVGGRTFVGEWRIAHSDPMRPTLGSTIVLSRYDADE